MPINTFADDEDGEALLQRQIAMLRLCGGLSLLFYGALSLAIIWRTSLHFLYSSNGAKKAFHVTLLISTLLLLPHAIEWIWFPTPQAWMVMYVCRLYSLLLFSICKSYLAVCWAGVVSAGQQLARHRVTNFVTGLNILLILWGLVIPILLFKFSDNTRGRNRFMRSTLRYAMTYSGFVVVFTYCVLLGYQGFRLRRRLLLARGAVPTESLTRSLNQLILAISIFLVSDVVRMLALLLNESEAAMPIVVYLILYSVIPHIFPTICMLYLMRRLTGRSGSEVNVVQLKVNRSKGSMSKYMTEHDSDGSTGSDGASRETVVIRVQGGKLQAQRHCIDLQVKSEQEYFEYS
ncbi:uncharacterized protein CCR75_009831 [Bremia lactucae]|uniref:RxLR effector candidate protein n=1 Tax=Bremia lactucae TaxID=4779 RepID=A0A976IDY5_BRELC|nr:hypothetical protein CCR75_009831 [Bremia lactucae]